MALAIVLAAKNHHKVDDSSALAIVIQTIIDTTICEKRQLSPFVPGIANLYLLLSKSIRKLYPWHLRVLL